MARQTNLSEDERLASICSTIRYCRDMRAAGMPLAAWNRALREAVFFSWEAYGQSKHKSAAWRSVASLAVSGPGLVYDHAIPFRMLRDALMALEAPNPAVVRPLLVRGTVAAIITAEENRQLTALGLQSKMPRDWDGQDPLARYRTAGITLSPNSRRGSAATPDQKRRQQMRRSARSSANSLERYEEHPKYAASSDRIKQICRNICAMLEAQGLRLSPSFRRDGFTFAGPKAIKLDPKVETLRIFVGLNPEVAVPPALAHQGRQPDWIVVDGHTEAAARTYLQSLVQAWR